MATKKETTPQTEDQAVQSTQPDPKSAQTLQAIQELQGMGFDLSKLLALFRSVQEAAPAIMDIIEKLVAAFRAQGMQALPAEAKTPNKHAHHCCQALKDHLVAALVEACKCEECCRVR